MKSKNPSEIIEVGGIKTSYLKEGNPSHRLVLFVHGWGGTKETWAPFLKPLAGNRFYSASLDLPGFGKSDRPGSWGVGEYSDFLTKFIREIGKEKATLVGRSFGARIVANLAVERGGFVDKLVLVSAAGIPDERLITRLKKTVASLGKNAFSLPGLRHFSDEAKEFLYKVYGVEDYTRVEGAKKEIFRKAAGFRLESQLPKINTSTLIIWGEKDEVTPVDNAYIMSGLIKNSKLVVIPNGGHQVQQDQKDRFLREVISFCRS